MDEIIIDDKRYISSKRAAHLTGYAKDYVGQLCREGRVQARLVGRAWYVLETAIQDHRFGSADTKEEQEPHAFVTKPVLPEQWDAARYSIPEPALLPELKKVALEPAVEPYEASIETESVKPVEESWEELFRSSVRVESATEESSSTVEQPGVVMTNIQPKISPVTSSVQDIRISSRHKKRNGVWTRVLSLSLMVVAALSVSTAALNSGFFDAYLISASRATVITGFSVYQKTN